MAAAFMSLELHERGNHVVTAGGAVQRATGLSGHGSGPGAGRERTGTRSTARVNTTTTESARPPPCPPAAVFRSLRAQIL
jgi:hypothetical protein